MIGLTFFFIHIICYWAMVFLYDKKVPIDDLKIAASSSLKNQLLYTLPCTVIFFNNYPIIYEHFFSSFGYFPILIISRVIAIFI